MNEINEIKNAAKEISDSIDKLKLSVEDFERHFLESANNE